MIQNQTLDINKARKRFAELRGDLNILPDTNIVIPVNTQGDLNIVLNILGDIMTYSGRYTFEVIFVVNNYPPNEEPEMNETYREMGIKVLPIPNVRRDGEAVGFTARFAGVCEATTDSVLLFDADCRIVNASALIDWYVEQFEKGADVAYTHVRYYQVKQHLSIEVQIFVHHLSRWFKRTVLGIPTTRGSNYAVRKSVLIPYYDEGLLADEMNVGPTVKKKGGQVVYSGRKDLVVMTSGRMFQQGWYRLYRYFLYRLRYNLRVLPVGKDVASRTGRENDPVRRYDDNIPVDQD
jgi:hypothetical protein